MDYPYLKHEVYYCRQTFAAHLLRDCKRVIELGGYETSIGSFLAPHQTCVTIDPALPEHDGVNKLKTTFQEADFKTGKNYGIVILGIQLLGMGPKHWKRLYDLIDGSNTTVIEVPEWERSWVQFNKIVASVGKKEVFRVVMDVSAPELDTQFTKRTVVCLR